MRHLWKLLLPVAVLWSSQAVSISLDEERVAIEKWRAERVAKLTSDTGWLTLAGLFWLKEGENTFGAAKSNAVVLDHPALTKQAGVFIRTGMTARFIARPDSGLTHEGKPVTSIDLLTDKAAGGPTVLAAGPLRFFLLDRSGNLGLRVRDLENERRKHFQGFQYFDINPAWRVDARFEPYQPRKQITVPDIVNMEQVFDCPGALVFTKDGQEYRLDALLEKPGDNELYVMFSDGTSGWETYGAGRYMYVPLPVDGKVPVDFNKAYNPPCAFNDFATCALPPVQNRLKLRIEAGEKKYAGAH